MSQKHVRTVEISYPFGFSSSERDTLHHFLHTQGIVNLDSWDTAIPSYNTEEVVSTKSVYTVSFDRGKLEFNYKTDAMDIIRQFESLGIEVDTGCEEVEEETVQVVEPSWNGSTILYLDAPYHLGSYSDKHHIISQNDDGETLVKLFVDFTAYNYSCKLTFKAEWVTEHTQKTQAIEDNLVHLPTHLMGQIQAVFEEVFVSEPFLKTMDEEPIISCMFDVVAKHSSECKPSVIEMLKEAKQRASSELQ